MGNYVRDTLLNGEALVYEARTTLWSYWPALFMAFSCLVGAFLVDDVATKILIGVGLGFVLFVATSVQTTELSVTNKRVVAKRGVFSRHLIELRLDRIETIRIKQSLAGRMLNYGSLLLAGSGNPVAPIGSIANPLEFRRVALEAQEEALSGSALRTYSPENSGSKLLGLAVLVLVAMGSGLAYRIIVRDQDRPQKAVEIVEGRSLSKPSALGQAESLASSRPTQPSSYAGLQKTSPSFTTYENAKYGYQLVVPSSLERVVNQSDENGEHFVSPDSEVSLTVSGAGTSGEPLEQLYQDSLNSIQGEVGYHVVSKNWFVISSKSGDTLRYQKTFAGIGSSNTFVLTFPETEKAEYVPAIDIMEKSFRHGDLDQAW